MIETHRFINLGLEHVLAVREFLGASFGPDAGNFSLGGYERLRGIPSDSITAKRIYLANIEWRFPLFYNLNYHMWYIFPDFFLKTVYGVLFTDVGLAWNDDSRFSSTTIDDWKGTCGVGVRTHTFVLQTFPLMFNFYLARQFEGPNLVFYFSTVTNF
jgi:outer membrane protein assembly factor BamA